MGEQLEKGLQVELKESEFIDIVQQLYSQGYLDKTPSVSGEDFFTLKKEQSSDQGGLFCSVLNKLSSASKQTLMDTAANSLADFLEITQITSGQSIMQTIAICAVIGTGGLETISENQKELIDYVFSNVLGYNGSMERFYQTLMRTPLTEDLYMPIENIAANGNPSVGMPLLYFILSFAYIDGSLKPDISKRLESIFSLVLLSQFFNQSEE